MPITYKARNDNVVVRVVLTGKQRGLAMPDISVQGKQYFIEAIGDKVENLKVGDRVFLTGQQRVDWDFLPWSKELLVIKEANIVIVVEGEDDNSEGEEPTKTPRILT